MVAIHCRDKFDSLPFQSFFLYGHYDFSHHVETITITGYDVEHNFGLLLQDQVGGVGLLLHGVVAAVEVEVELVHCLPGTLDVQGRVVIFILKHIMVLKI